MARAQRLCGVAFVILVTIGGAGLTTAEDSGAAKSDVERIRFFESRIRPVLVQRCYECHAASSGIAEGELRVDSQEALRRGGSRGPAVVPGRPKASLILAAISHSDEDLKMPPEGEKLSAQEIADFTKWIRNGAKDPRKETDGQIGRVRAGIDHWSYQRPRVYRAPKVHGDESWAHDDIDRFVLATLEQHGLTPSPDASEQTVLRRIHFALLGLPPSHDSIEQFEDAVRTTGVEQAIAAEVDSLLAQPQFGEHWARKWLDVARYAESSGGEANTSFPHAWRYRDYVIDAFNDDIPFNRFLTEQIAGDLLPYEGDAERARLLVATGYLAVGTKNLNENNEKQFQSDVIDEQIDTVTRGVMACSVACARCHDHKFDPFSMTDYYALAGIFRSSKTYFGTHTSPANNRSGDPLPLPRVKGQKVLHASLTPKKFTALKERMRLLEAEWSEMQAANAARFAGRKPEKSFTLTDVLGNIWKRGPIEGKLESLDSEGRARPIAMGVLDREEIVDAPLLSRGDIRRPGLPVLRGFPTAIEIEHECRIPEHQSGRLELAKWLTHPNHPLTSRVIVNRVWHSLFGSGLVETVDDFGTTGQPPSHPELLDTLAVRFVQDEWSVKRLVRRIILSRTWRQSSAFNQHAFSIDPGNRYLWRMEKRRLEAEAIRDAMLFASGTLDLTRPDGSLVARAIGDKPISLIGLNKRVPPDLDADVHRSVYLPIIRDRLPDILDLFDFADPSFVTGHRDQTNVPVQALYLMNSQFVMRRADGLAEILHTNSNDMNERIRLAFRRCFGRDPDEAEMQRSVTFLRQEAEGREIDDKSALAHFSQALFATSEFLNVD